MSHIDHIGSGVNAAAEYQEYLARLGAGLRSRRGTVSGEKRELRTFDSAIDPDQEPEDQRPSDEEDEDEGDPGEDAGGGQHWQIKA